MTQHIDPKKVASNGEVLTAELCIVAGLTLILHVVDPDAAWAAVAGYAVVWLLRAVRAVVRQARRGRA